MRSGIVSLVQREKKPDISFSVLPSNNEKDTKDGREGDRNIEKPVVSKTIQQGASDKPVKYEI